MGDWWTKHMASRESDFGVEGQKAPVASPNSDRALVVTGLVVASLLGIGGYKLLKSIQEEHESLTPGKSPVF